MASGIDESLIIWVAGLVLSGLFLLGTVAGLVRPVLPDATPARWLGRLRRHFPSAARLGVIALVLGTVLIVSAVVGGQVVGDQTGLSRAESTSTVAAQALAAPAPAAVPGTVPDNGGRWLAGDMHTHTFLTGGTFPLADVARNGLGKYGLDWMANSEHGGSANWDPQGNPAPATPRWWSMMAWSWPIIDGLRPLYPGRVLFQATEWNVPKHGHAGVGFAYDDPSVVGEFDYRFDAKSSSTSFPGAPPKDNKTRQSAVSGIRWLQTNYPQRSYMVLNHPSRWLNYSPGDIRDFIEAGPDVVAGFEGMPGHQKQSNRGGYVWANPLARTYQGADVWLAQVGGVWDSILANGSRFHVFADSDFHGTRDEFWPGEYTKNWTYVERPDDVQSIIEGLKSGRSFTSHGDIIDGLRFYAQADGARVDMSRDALAVRRGDDVVVTIKFHTPAENNNDEKPSVDHLDLIAGSVIGPAAKGTASWEASTNPSAHVVGTFDSGALQELGDGWYAATYLLPRVEGPMYLRLRATNVPRNTPGMTDIAGNPLMDPQSADGERTAWKTLWFYSNPIWIDIR